MTSSEDLEARALALFERSLDQPEAERADWIAREAGDDAALRERTQRLLSFDRPGSAIRTGSAVFGDDEDQPVPERIGSYLVTGIIGQGGMGTVYRGERATGDFDHDVAIKVIKLKVLSDELVDRFQRERQTLANLSHRHIARLYDGGTMDNGAPYIIMEYVDGSPITEYCEVNELPLARRLDLFLDACDAVAYAHRNLVIHRDLTPSNILVTKDGEVKLIDFGIAKPFADETQGPAPAASIPSLSFTPGFAAPERRKGGMANTLSDVYSLGKLLEALVPKQAQSTDMGAIIAKAAAPEPTARYASVDALTEDVRRMQAGYAVSARVPSSAYRLSRYVGRHRIGTALAVLAVGGLLTAFAVTVQEYIRAENALASANARFEQSRGLARSMVFDIYDEIALISGTLEIRKELADVLRDYVDELANDPYTPDDILMDVAVQYNRLSDLYGGIGISNLGDAETSYALLLRAEETLDRLLARDGTNVEAIDELVWSLRLRTNQELVYNLDVEAARAANERALSLAAKGLELPGADETRLIDRFWNARTDSLKVLGYANEQEEALAAVRQYRAELADPGMAERVSNYDRKAAYFASQEGEILADLQRPEEALAPFADALYWFRASLEEQPESYYFLVQNMRLEGLMAASARRAGDTPAALDAAMRAVALAERIREADPEDANGDHFVASQLEQLAKAYAQDGQDTLAEETIEQAIATRRAVAGRFPDVLNHRRDLALTYKEAGMVYGDTGNPELSCRYLADAAAIMDELAAAGTLTDFDVEERMTEIADLQAQYCGG